MSRARPFHIQPVDRLETRLVLSHVHPAAAAAKPHAKPHHAAVTPLPSLAITGVVRDTSSTGQVTTVESDYFSNGHGGVTAMQTTTYPDKSRKIQYGTASTVNGVITSNLQNLLPTGAEQTEVDRDAAVQSVGVLHLDGTVTSGPGTPGPIVTHHINNIVTQAGLGTQTTVGTRVEGKVGAAFVEVTTEQVTNFDGTVDQVRIVQTDALNSPNSTRTTTTTHANGTSATTTDKITVLSGGIY